MICFNTRSDVVARDIADVLAEDLPWQNLRGKTVAVTGAAGMLAAYVVESLLMLGDVKVVALVRNIRKAQVRFGKYATDSNLALRQYSCQAQPPLEDDVAVIVHAASLPRPDVDNPVDVMLPNLQGTYWLLEWARRNPSFEQFVYFSSAAVYGEVKGDVLVGEHMGEHVDSADVRNCYSVAKMSGEALCVAYGRQYGIVTKILRYAHTYGPGMDMARDSRAFAEFMRNAILGKDIRLQTLGCQKRSYCYISDATIAFFRVLFFGDSGCAYNVVNDSQTYSIREFAQHVAECVHDHVGVIDNGIAVAGYAPQHHAALPDPARMNSLGWQPVVALQEGVKRTMMAYLIT